MGEIRLDLQLRHAKSCLVEYGEKLRQAELQLEVARSAVDHNIEEITRLLLQNTSLQVQLYEACAEVERYKAGIEVIGELSTYPSRSKIVFEGNDQISELRGIDSQRVRVVIMKLEGENETVSL